MGGRSFTACGRAAHAEPEQAKPLETVISDTAVTKAPTETQIEEPVSFPPDASVSWLEMYKAGMLRVRNRDMFPIQ